MRENQKDSQELDIKESLSTWVDGYFFAPSPIQKVISFALLPLSFLYCALTLFKKVFRKEFVPPLPVVSIGNLTLGGTGKTPLAIALAKKYPNSCVLLRGYGRMSKGLVVVSDRGAIPTTIDASGDEAMMIAKSLPSASVIVSEDRVLGIQKAHELGCGVVFLDDGFRHAIKKLNIIIEPKDGLLPFCLPSGAYREAPFLARFADMRLKEGVDFTRKVSIKNPTQKMALLTAISNPARLEPYLGTSVIAKRYLRDHSYFDKNEVLEFLRGSGADSILCTQKDAVKLDGFGVPLSYLELEIDVDGRILEVVDGYVRCYTIPN